MAAQATNGVYVTLEHLLGLGAAAKGLLLNPHRPSLALMSGQNHTRFRGRGMEFAEVRPYQAGDDIRTIDWRVTARTQTPYTKLFQEEREQPILILVDQRSPLFFGSQHMMKAVYAAEIAGLLAWAAHHHGDKVGGLFIGDSHQSDLRSTRGKAGLMHFFNALCAHNKALNQPMAFPNALGLSQALQQLNRVVKPGSQVFLISDFHDFTSDCAEPLALMSKRCDLMAFNVFDPLEAQLPARAWLRISNGKQRLTLDTQALNTAYQQGFQQQQQQFQQLCLQHRILAVQAPVQASAVPLLNRLFHPKARAGRTLQDTPHG